MIRRIGGSVIMKEFPRLGGLAFFPSIVLSMSLVVGYRYLIGFSDESPIKWQYIVGVFFFLSAGCLFLYMTGVEDDLIGVRYRKKFFYTICRGFFTSGIRFLSG